jgi:hypothetical protein
LYVRLSDDDRHSNHVTFSASLQKEMRNTLTNMRRISFQYDELSCTIAMEECNSK